MISFIVHYRPDNEERVKNFHIVYEYYRTILPDCQFVFVEDNFKPTIQDQVKDSDNYIIFLNKGIYNKCRSYNYGLQDAKNDIVCFLDIDCVVSKDNLLHGLEVVSNEDCICIGYNGVAIYVNYSLKKQVEHIDVKDIYDYLEQQINPNKIYTNYSTSDYLIGNTQAVGGCLLGKKSVFQNIKGFNENFIGWGYEDNEIISRCKILKVPGYGANTKKPWLFHLPHEVVQRDKSKHSFYEHNHKEIQKVESMNRQQLEEYIATW